MDAAAIHSELSGDKFRVLEERLRAKSGSRSIAEVARPNAVLPATPTPAMGAHEGAGAETPGGGAAKRARSSPETLGSGGRASKQRSSTETVKGAQITDFYATSTMATPSAPGGHVVRQFAPPPRHAHAQTEPLAEEAEVRRLKEELALAQRQVRINDDSLEPLRVEVARLKGLELRSREQTIAWLRRLCRLEKAAAREAATRNSAHLGTVGWQRVGANMTEVWEPGNAFRELHLRQAELQSHKESLERDRRALAGQAKKRASAAATVEAEAAHGDGSMPPPPALAALHGHGLTEREEGLRLKAATLKRQEGSLVDEAARIERDKLLHIRELKRIRDEVRADGARFRSPASGRSAPRAASLRRAAAQCKHALAPSNRGGVIHLNQLAGTRPTRGADSPLRARCFARACRRAGRISLQHAAAALGALPAARAAGARRLLRGLPRLRPLRAQGGGVQDPPALAALVGRAQGQLHAPRHARVRDPQGSAPRPDRGAVRRL
jgi:hypothetical protein